MYVHLACGNERDSVYGMHACLHISNHFHNVYMPYMHMVHTLTQSMHHINFITSLVPDKRILRYQRSTLSNKIISSVSITIARSHKLHITMVVIQGLLLGIGIQSSQFLHNNILKYSPTTFSILYIFAIACMYTQEGGFKLLEEGCVATYSHPATETVALAKVQVICKT